VGAGAAVRSVYVHAPFCERRCPYCDFAVQVRRVGDVHAWLEALAAELRAVEAEGRFPLARCSAPTRWPGSRVCSGRSG
jgi:coproporphyrinogen III oxidase-like Fe-S oxidoreductase